MWERNSFIVAGGQQQITKCSKVQVQFKKKNRAKLIFKLSKKKHLPIIVLILPTLVLVVPVWLCHLIPDSMLVRQHRSRELSPHSELGNHSTQTLLFQLSALAYFDAFHTITMSETLQTSFSVKFHSPLTIS